METGRVFAKLDYPEPHVDSLHSRGPGSHKSRLCGLADADPYGEQLLWGSKHGGGGSTLGTGGDNDSRGHTLPLRSGGKFRAPWSGRAWKFLGCDWGMGRGGGVRKESLRNVFSYYGRCIEMMHRAV